MEVGITDGMFIVPIEKDREKFNLFKVEFDLNLKGHIIVASLDENIIKEYITRYKHEVPFGAKNGIIKSDINSLKIEKLKG